MKIKLSSSLTSHLHYTKLSLTIVIPIMLFLLCSIFSTSNIGISFQDKSWILYPSLALTIPLIISGIHWYIKYVNRAKVIKYVEYIVDNYKTVSPILESTYGYNCSFEDTTLHNDVVTITIRKNNNDKPIVVCKLLFFVITKIEYNPSKIKDLFNAIDDIIKTI